MFKPYHWRKKLSNVLANIKLNKKSFQPGNERQILYLKKKKKKSVSSGYLADIINNRDEPRAKRPCTSGHK